MSEITPIQPTKAIGERILEIHNLIQEEFFMALKNAI